MKSSLSKFKKDLLPNPLDYFLSEGVDLIGRGDWRSAHCPFHTDKNPSLRIFIHNGGFRCFSCGIRGGDILAFHQLRHDLKFVEAAKSLHAWEES